LRTVESFHLRRPRSNWEEAWPTPSVKLLVVRVSGTGRCGRRRLRATRLDSARFGELDGGHRPFRLVEHRALARDAQQQHGGVVVAHLALLPQCGNLLLPLGVGHLPVAVPVGRRARLGPARGPLGDRVAAQHQHVVVVARLVQGNELLELVAV